MKTLSEEVAGTQLQIEVMDAAEAQATDTTLAAMYERAKLSTLASISRGTTLGVPLSPEDLAVWRWRYPTVYRWPLAPEQPDTPDRQLVLRWGTLPWPVPAHVCGLIQHCLGEIGKGPRLVDALEIWTPELHRQAPRVASVADPILVGWIGRRAYLLARWAEALEPFSEIRARADSRRGRTALRVRNRYLFEEVETGPWEWRVRQAAAWAGWVLA